MSTLHHPEGILLAGRLNDALALLPTYTHGNMKICPLDYGYGGLL
jgi:hypothetical protein